MCWIRETGCIFFQSYGLKIILEKCRKLVYLGFKNSKANLEVFKWIPSRVQCVTGFNINICKTCHFPYNHKSGVWCLCYDKKKSAKYAKILKKIEQQVQEKTKDWGIKFRFGVDNLLFDGQWIVLERNERWIYEEFFGS